MSTKAQQFLNAGTRLSATEIATGDNRGPAVDRLVQVAGGDRGDAWCVHYLTASAQKAGNAELYTLLKSTDGAVRNLESLARNAGAWHKGTRGIEAGDIAVLSTYSHVGIATGNGAELREGNTPLGGGQDGIATKNRTGEIKGYIDFDTLNAYAIERARGHSSDRAQEQAKGLLNGRGIVSGEGGADGCFIGNTRICNREL